METGRCLLATTFARVKVPNLDVQLRRGGMQPPCNRGQVVLLKTRKGLLHAFERPRDLAFLSRDSGHRIPGRRPKGRIIGMHSYGASAPLKDLQKKFGFTVDAVVKAAHDVLGK